MAGKKGLTIISIHPKGDMNFCAKHYLIKFYPPNSDEISPSKTTNVNLQGDESQWITL